jgi:flagellar secretion chaperone FliS
MYASQNALAQYRKINNESAVEGATPHRLIQMLMSGGLDRLAQAKGAMERDDIAGKGLLIGKAISIIAGLQASLDRTYSSELAARLESLYDYMQRRLFEANIKNDSTILDEVADLLRTVKSGWDEIAPEVKQES